MVLHMFSDIVKFEDLDLPECTCVRIEACTCPFHKAVKKRGTGNRKETDKRYYVKRRADPEKFERYKEQQREYSRRKRQMIKETDPVALAKNNRDAKDRYHLKKEINRLNGILLDDLPENS